jgi:hypothetical protein
MSRPWIKTPVSKLNDARLHFVSVQAQRDYLFMYMLAGQLDQDGLFFENERQLTEKEIAFRINTKPATLMQSIKELKREKLLHINGKGPQILDWGNEQINWREKQEAERERQQRHRGVTRDSEAVTRDGDDVTPLDQIKKKTRPEEDKKKTRPTPTPSATRPGKSAPRGRKAGKEVGSGALSFDDLTPKQSKRAERAQKILASLGIRNPKLKTTSSILATRHFKSDEQMVVYLVAAIASAYADGNAKSKEAVILHRIENNSVPRSFIEDKKLWRSVPVETLAIASATGIDINDDHDKLIGKLRQRNKESND